MESCVSQVMLLPGEANGLPTRQQPRNGEVGLACDSTVPTTPGLEIDAPQMSLGVKALHAGLHRDEVDVEHAILPPLRPG